jgi:hypothetical protein
VQVLRPVTVLDSEPEPRSAYSVLVLVTVTLRPLLTEADGPPRPVLRP